MSIIQLNNLSFTYPGKYEPIFKNVTLQLNSTWKLGLIGRNGRGKTTLLKLLSKELKRESGIISTQLAFSYFPFAVNNKEKRALEVLKETIAPFSQMSEKMEQLLEKEDEESLLQYAQLHQTFIEKKGYEIEELIVKEVSKLQVDPLVLQQPFFKLSGGEQTKVLLACLFLKDNQFLLIDEPTNHLDLEGREVVSNYLKGKKGYILVSHDRTFLNNCVDHILSINRNTISLHKGSFDNWQFEKEKEEQAQLEKNQQLKKEINRLQEASKQTAGWSQTLEKTKNGVRIAGLRPDRGYIGAKSAKMMKRAKVIEERTQKTIRQKESLFEDQEQQKIDLQMQGLNHHKKLLIQGTGLKVQFSNKTIFENIHFTLNQGDRLCVQGKNGCGKSTLMKILAGFAVSYEGDLQVASKIVVSYTPQTTESLKGSLLQLAQQKQVDYTQFLTLLRKLGFERNLFEEKTETYSMGQKKKVLLALSMCKPAHIYLWDEPLNYIDLESRLQIENLIKKSNISLIFVEHDKQFCEAIATDYLVL